MSWESIVTIIVAVLASPLLTKLVDTIAAKLDKKEKPLSRVEKKVDGISEDLKDIKLETIRTNLMVLLADYRSNDKIPEQAEIYVKLYNGDSYIIPLICDWYKEKNIDMPEWLIKARKEHDCE